ncbi:MAG: dUTPase [Christensenellales bacterium]|jgi:dimeric dUTPase (all-alpha-NTP-PPase superfamily)
MDKLEAIFDKQLAFNQYMEAKRQLPQVSREVWVQRECMAMMVELSEVLEEVNYKWWKNPKPLDEAAIKEELVDVLHFFVSACQKMGMTAQELYDGYMDKNQENFNRQDGKGKKTGYAPGETP